ncbi:hypothetical protein [Ideonella sp. BN130291]|uniref:hypothetical protein n=1 Tax=Ideonella sp. BN130291 TaxID=3112940 RepID=UPI002E25560B|nr:hypothetical protein [Ideonella sp. BN130291]
MSNNAAPVPSARTESPRGDSVAEVAIATWKAVQAALVPIVGQGGFVALYRRSLHLTCVGHPWLAAADEGTERSADFQALLHVLRGQPPEQAQAANEQLLQSFQAILASLIGASLVQRLLGAVLVVPPIGHAEQGPFP